MFDKVRLAANFESDMQSFTEGAADGLFISNVPKLNCPLLISLENHFAISNSVVNDNFQQSNAFASSF